MLNRGLEIFHVFPQILTALRGRHHMDAYTDSHVFSKTAQVVMRMRLKPLSLGFT